MAISDGFDFDPARRPGIPGIDVNERPMSNADAKLFGRPAPDPTNPSFSKGPASPEAVRYAEGLRANPAPAPAGAAPPAPATPYQRGVGIGRQVGQFLDKPVVRGASRLVGIVGTANSGFGAVNDFQSGNVAGGVENALDAAASAGGSGAFGPAGVGLGIAYGGGKLAGTGIYNALGDTTKEGIGRFLNRGAQLFGGGVDDSALRALNQKGLAATPADAAGIRAGGGGAGRPPTPTNNIPGAPQGPGSDYAPGLAAVQAALIQEREAAKGSGFGGGGNVISGQGLRAGSPTLDAQVAAARAAAAARGESTDLDKPGGVTTLGGDGFGILSKAYQDQRNASFNLSSINPETRRAGEKQLADFNAQKLQESKTRGDLQAEGIRAGVSLRGQDITARGQDIDSADKRFTSAATLEGNRARLQFDLNKDSRDFGLRRETEDRQARQSSQESLRKRLESMNVTEDKDGNAVVDRRAVAEQEAGIQGFLKSKAAEARVKGRPDIAEQIEKQGVDTLGPQQFSEVTQALKLKSIARDSAGIGAFSGQFIESGDPSGYRIVGETTSAAGVPLYKLANGTTVPKRKVDFDKGGNAVIPNIIGNNRSNAFTDIGQPVGR